MPKLFLKFSLAKHFGEMPATFVAAADLNRNRQADPGEYFDIKPSGDAWEWTGTLSFENPEKVHGIVVMLVYSATPGVKYKLEVRKDSAEGPVLVEDEDIVRAFPEAGFYMLKEQS